MADFPDREVLARIVKERGMLELDEPVALASGDLSRYFVDAKAALARGEDLERACRAVMHVASDRPFDAVGGLTMGADKFAHVIAVLSKRQWFAVRKEPKRRGTNRLVEGAELRPETSVLLVEDVMTDGGSIRRAYEAVVDAGATVVGAVAFVDRKGVGGRFFEEQGVPFRALLTYADLGIPAVGSEGFASSEPLRALDLYGST